MSTVYAKITNGAGLVVSGNGTTGWTQVVTPDFDQALSSAAGSAFAASGSGVITGGISFSLDDSGVAVRAGALVSSGGAGLQTVEFAVYDDQGRLTDDYSFGGALASVSASFAPDENSSPDFDQEFSLRYLKLQDVTTVYDPNTGSATSTTQSRNFAQPNKPVGLSATGLSTDTTLQNNPDTGYNVDYFVRFIGPNGNVLSADGGATWFGLASGSYGLQAPVGSGGITFSPLSLSFGAGGINQALFTSALGSGLVMSEIEIVGFTGQPGAQNKIVSDLVFGGARVTSQIVDLEPDTDTRTTTFAYSGYSEIHYGTVSSGFGGSTSATVGVVSGATFQPTTLNEYDLYNDIGGGGGLVGPNVANIDYALAFGSGSATSGSASIAGATFTTTRVSSGAGGVVFSPLTITFASAPDLATQSSLAALSGGSRITVTEGRGGIFYSSTPPSETYVFTVKSGGVSSPTITDNGDGTSSYAYSIGFNAISEKHTVNPPPAVPPQSSWEHSWNRVSLVSSGFEVGLSGTEVASYSLFGAHYAVSSGALLEVVSGGVVSSSIVLGGGTEIIAGRRGNAGGFSTEANGTVSAGGVLYAINGGIAQNLTIDDGGFAEAYISGGTILGATVESGAIILAGSGGIVSRAQINSGGYELDYGGVGSGAVVFDGGANFVGVSGSAVGATISLGGLQEVLSTGIALGTVISDGALQLVLASGSSFNAIVSSGGTALLVNGFQSGTSVGNGGVDYVEGANGLALGDVILSGGAELVLAGGTAGGTIVSNGGVQVVSATGFAVGTVLSSGGAQVVLSGGYAYGGVVSNGGVEYIQSGGVQSTGLDASGGATIVLGGGKAIGLAIGSGGITVQSSGGAASGLIVSQGGYDVVLSGGVVSGATLQSGGNIIVQAGGALSGAIAMSGVNNVITVASGASVAGAKFSDFNLGDYFDLKAIGYTSGVTSVSYAGNAQSGTVTVTSGAKSVSLNLLGQYVAGNFTLQADGAGGTLLGDPPVSSGALAHA